MKCFIPFSIALQFLTMIPVRLKQQPTDHQLGQSLLYYPLVGVVIGALLIALIWLFSAAPVDVVAVVVLVSWVGITGALHLDGLADCADAWMGGLGDKAKTLAIMKDPACGPVAVCVLVLALLIKFVLLTEMIALHSLLMMLAATIISRTALPLLFLTTPYVRRNGIGSVMVSNQPVQQSKWLMLSIGVLGLIVFPWFVMVSTLLVFLLLRYAMERRLGGATGDTAGAMVEILEIWVLLSFLIVG